jgi:Ca2+/Na+ antiporter
MLAGVLIGVGLGIAALLGAFLPYKDEIAQHVRDLLERGESSGDRAKVRLSRRTVASTVGGMLVFGALQITGIILLLNGNPVALLFLCLAIVFLFGYQAASRRGWLD